MTLTEYLRDHPAKPIRLYRPHPKDWYGETKRYLYRVKDCERRVWALRKRCAELDAVDAPDEDLVLYRDELHKRLGKAEQDMQGVTGEVTELLAGLPDANQRAVMVERYLHRASWKRIAAKLDIPVSEVLAYHQSALPILKRALSAQSNGCTGHT